MIQILDPHLCCGCEACAQSCPTNAIELVRDSEGFLYPSVIAERCIDCGVCNKVCPVEHQAKARTPKELFAARSNNPKTVELSSSGGVFTELAEHVINNGGVVFGARFNKNWAVEHTICRSREELASLRGSKYSQSRIGETFKEAKKELTSGTEVLFTGSPCQIAALRLYLKREYDNLTTADFICHGVPSPGIWEHYINILSQENKIIIKSLSHRDKSNGWHNYSLRVKGEKFSLTQSLRENSFLKGFNKDLFLRPSCHTCPAKSFKSGSDITLADFWGIEKYIKEDDKGYNMVIVHTEKGRKMLNSCDCELTTCSPRAIQKIAYTSPKESRKRALFFKRVNQDKHSFEKIVNQLTQPPLYKHITRPIGRIVSQLLHCINNKS